MPESIVTIVTENAILVSMDVTSLYTNIPQEDGITTVYNAYERFHNNKPPIPTHYLRDKRTLFSFTESITSKYMEPLWALRWQYLLPTYSWLRLRQKS